MSQPQQPLQILSLAAFRSRGTRVDFGLTRALRIIPRAGVAGPVIRTLSILAVLLICSGCQTFTLSEEDFYNQQRGKMVDPQTGRAVEVAGTAGYAGALIGAAVASAFK